MIEIIRRERSIMTTRRESSNGIWRCAIWVSADVRDRVLLQMCIRMIVRVK
jgi:hypothetical protein